MLSHQGVKLTTISCCWPISFMPRDSKRRCWHTLLPLEWQWNWISLGWLKHVGLCEPVRGVRARHLSQSARLCDVSGKSGCRSGTSTLEMYSLWWWWSVCLRLRKDGDECTRRTMRGLFSNFVLPQNQSSAFLTSFFQRAENKKCQKKKKCKRIQNMKFYDWPKKTKDIMKCSYVHFFKRIQSRLAEAAAWTVLSIDPQLGETVPPARSGSSLRPPPSGTCPGNLLREVSKGHLNSALSMLKRSVWIQRLILLVIAHDCVWRGVFDHIWQCAAATAMINPFQHISLKWC